MRGLTPIERECLAWSLTTDESEHVSVAHRACFSALSARGLVSSVKGGDVDWVWTDWLATDLGRLALRVCPMEEMT